jgi:hypothetical protein
MKKIVLSLIIPFLINAGDISQGELSSFAAQKYKIDYKTQNKENKDKLKKEYEDTIKVSTQISNDIKNDIDYNVAKKILAINVWTQKYAQNLKISNDTLEELYAKEKPKTVPIYNLYNILVSDKKKADEIYVNLKKLPKESRLKEFKKQVNLKSQDFISNKKEGNIGWIEIQKLDKNIQEKIKDKIKNDMFISEVENIGYQIILINDFKPIRDVSFDESKEFLIKLAKKQELIKKIQSMLK